MNIQVTNTLVTELSSDKLGFLTGVMAGNMSELPMRPDEAEFQMLMNILQSANFDLFNRSATTRTNVPTERANYVRFKVDIHLADVAVTAFAGSDADEYTKLWFFSLFNSRLTFYYSEATSLAKIIGTNINIKINLERDGSLIVRLPFFFFSESLSLDSLTCRQMIADAQALTITDARPNIATNQFKACHLDRLMASVLIVLFADPVHGNAFPDRNGNTFQFLSRQR